MAKKLKIRYPEKDGQVLVWLKDPGAFVAFGAAREMDLVKGTITYTSGGAPVEGVPLRHPKKKIWIILFTGIPFGKEFDLLVQDESDASAKDEKKKLKLGPPKVKPLRAISFFYPPSPATVCPDFVAYGPNDESGTVTCKLEKAGQEDVPGVPVQNGPVWVQLFSRVFPDTYDTIRVTCTSSDHHDTITVDGGGLLCAELT